MEEDIEAILQYVEAQWVGTKKTWPHNLELYCEQLLSVPPKIIQELCPVMDSDVKCLLEATLPALSNDIVYKKSRS